MARTGMISIITRKEVTEMVEMAGSGCYRSSLGASRLLRSSSGCSRRSKSSMSAKKPRRAPRRSGKAKEKKNPHVAAHYGTHVFAPAAMTTAIDPGVSNFLGRSIKIEAHKRNLSAHSRAQDSGANNQLGAFSVATILLSLMPLLIIALGYGAWGRERERGTLRQLLSTVSVDETCSGVN